jgi:hypothetical protein
MDLGRQPAPSRTEKVWLLFFANLRGPSRPFAALA